MPTTIVAIRFCEVLPRKLLASAAAGRASRTARVARTIRMPRFCPLGSALMRVTIAASCLSCSTIGVAILAATPDFERLPPGGRAIAYIGVALAWGFVGVGAYAWLRRPDNRTGTLMTLVGVGVALTGLQLFDSDVLWVIGATIGHADRVAVRAPAAGVPSGRLEGRAARIVVAIGYVAGALEPLLVLFSPCEGVDCPSKPGADRRRRRRSPSVVAAGPGLAVVRASSPRCGC